MHDFIREFDIDKKELPLLKDILFRLFGCKPRLNYRSARGYTDHGTVKIYSYCYTLNETIEAKKRIQGAIDEVLRIRKEKFLQA